MAEKKIGTVFSYYANIGVAAIQLTDGSLKSGEMIHIKGTTTDFTQTVDSMQVEHKEVKEAKKGSSVGIKVVDRVRPNDEVFKE
ncbi:translation elongation factor-like protein [Candidatus Woesearchaeota archaeon]|nr:translation elongation factor-like protein [Candidatus Woesearchaeota archaeon]